MHHCTSGVTECGSLLARVDSRTQEKTLRCILVQAIGALRPAVVVLCIREHPNRGVTTKVKEIWQGFARCYPLAHRWLKGPKWLEVSEYPIKIFYKYNRATLLVN